MTSQMVVLAISQTGLISGVGDNPDFVTEIRNGIFF